jgi:GTP cyclohydrolase II
MMGKEGAVDEALTRECLTGNCGKTATLEELRAKLSGKPDFAPDERYCAGAGKFCLDEDFCVQMVAHTGLPTRFGDFELYGFYDAREDKEHTALVRGEVEGAEGLPVRVHSECHTGDVLGSLRCDCRDQLEAALRHLGGREKGALLYLKQEGRGIGLLNKIKAYRLQELGLDTVEANLYLGYPGEGRDYKVAAKMHEQPGQDRQASGRGYRGPRKDPPRDSAQPARRRLPRRQKGQDGAPLLTRRSALQSHPASVIKVGADLRARRGPGSRILEKER